MGVDTTISEVARNSRLPFKEIIAFWQSTCQKSFSLVRRLFLLQLTVHQKRQLKVRRTIKSIVYDGTAEVPYCRLISLNWK
jgi:hypothetical protein